MPILREEREFESIREKYARSMLGTIKKGCELFEIYPDILKRKNTETKFKTIYSQYRVHYGKTEIWLLSEVFEPDQYLPHLQSILNEFNTGGLPKEDVGHFVTIMVKYFFTKLGEQWNLFPCMNRFYPYISWFYDIDLEHNRILVCLPPDNVASGKAKLSDVMEICDGTTAEASVVVKKLLDSMLKPVYSDTDGAWYFPTK